jgi:serine/threonine-protein kinase
MPNQPQPSGSSGSFAALRLPIPPEVANRVAGRLPWFVVFVVCAVFTLVTADVLLQPQFLDAVRRPFVRLTHLVLLLASLAFAAVHRQGRLSRALLLDLGLAYQVLGSFTICVFETSVDWNPDVPARGLSGLTAWLLLCGVLLPNAPWKAGLTAALSAACWPLAYWINLELNGFRPLTLNLFLVWFGPIAMASVFMYLINRRTIAMAIREYKAEQLGSYELLHSIGRGGMGQVWRAKHRMLARDAAVKLIRPEVVGQDAERQESLLLKRFEREAQATARLQSPHTVALYDYGRSKDGVLYYVMELLDGIDLQTLVERHGPMPPGRVVNTLLQVCESLEEAHRAGLVHLDIKPRNILLCRLGLQHDFVKVLDFGLVKVLHQPDQSRVTLEGSAAGTPAFVAPEIAMGQPEIDGRADLYGLGCVAYYLFTGQLVFDKPSVVAQALAHVQETPVPPSRRTELPIPASLETLVLQLLAKDPAARPASALHLARALRALEDIPAFSPEAAAEWWRLHAPQ